MWSTIELGFAITCACLPTLAPILPSIVGQWSHLRSWTASIWYSSTKTSTGSGSRGYKVPDNYELSHETMRGAPSGQNTQGASFYGSSQSWARGSSGRWTTDNGHGPLPSTGIMVDRNVEVV